MYHFNNSIEISLDDFYENHHKNKFQEIVGNENDDKKIAGGKNPQMEKGQLRSQQNFRKPSSFDTHPDPSVQFKDFGQATVILSRADSIVTVFEPTQSYKGLLAKVGILRRLFMTKDFVIKRTLLDQDIVFEGEDDVNSEFYADAFIGAYLNRLRSISPRRRISISPCFMQVLDWFKTEEILMTPMKMGRNIFTKAHYQYVLMERATYSMQEYLQASLLAGIPTFGNLLTFISILMHSLESAFHFYHYIHYDLHLQNTMVTLLSTKKAGYYKNKVDQIWKFERSREKPDDDVDVDVKEEKTYLYIQPEDHINVLPLIIDPGRNFIQVPFANAQDHGYRFEKEAININIKTSFFHCKMDYEKFGIYYHPDYLNRGWDLRIYALSLLRRIFGFGRVHIKNMEKQSKNEDLQAFKIIIMKMLQIGKISITIGGILFLMRDKIRKEFLKEMGSIPKTIVNFMNALALSIKYIKDRSDYSSAYEVLLMGLKIPEFNLRIELLLRFWAWTPFIGVKNLDDEKTKQQRRELKIPFYEYTSATDILNDDYFQKKFFFKKKPDLSQYTDNREIVPMAKWVHPAQLEKTNQFTNFTPLECKICKTKDISTLQICSSCNKVAYCSRDCQVKDWLEHKLECI